MSDTVKLILLAHTCFYTRTSLLFHFANSCISLSFYMLYNVCVLRGICQERNKFSLLFFFPPATRARYRRARERENCKHRPGRPSPTSAILSPKGVLDWLSNVDTTTVELRNHVRHSTWSLIELSGISPALSRQLVPDVPFLP